MRAVAGLIVVFALALAVTPAGARAAATYTRCEPIPNASIVEVSEASCDEARALATQLVAAPAAAAAAILKAAGWAALRAQDTTDGREHDLVALRGPSAVRIRRAGGAPDLDGWAANRELVFARARLVGGKPVPPGTAVCTSAFLVLMPGGSLGGLSAAHCAGTRKDGTVQRRNAAMRRPPQPGIVLGRVQRNLRRSRPLDALVVPIPSGPKRPISAVVDRGVARPPWRVAGVARPTNGRRVCFSGRTSGIDQCGAILGSRARRAELLLSVFSGRVLRCTTIVARGGDSGGPVYTAPTADGTVRAIGIVSAVPRGGTRMCFTPIGPVLSALGASVISAARVPVGPRSRGTKPMAGFAFLMAADFVSDKADERLGCTTACDSHVHG